MSLKKEPTEHDSTDRKPVRRIPTRWQSTWILASSDLEAVWRSWLTRGFLLVSVLFTLLEFKGMQAEQKAASEMLEAVYVTYLALWMHGVIFIAGGALSREQHCLNDAILSRGVTRGEYIMGKLTARFIAVFLIIGGLLIPASFWAVRQDALVRTDDGFVASNARNTKVEAWEPRKSFAGVDGLITELNVEVGDKVQVGDVLAQFDDRRLFDDLEMERRNEENARNEVVNSRRRAEDSKRSVAQAEDALARAERAIIAKDLLSKLEQSNREADIRSRKRDLKSAQNQLQIAEDAVSSAERSVENAMARVREARKRLGQATVLAPVSGYVTEVPVQAAQHVGLGAHLLTVAPLDDYQVSVPIYQFEEFKRLEEGLKAYITIEETEYTGAIEKLGATTRPDRWGRDSNYALVRFHGDGTLGLLGQNADVRLALPPPDEKPSRVTSLFNALTGRGEDDLETRTTSVTIGWMFIGLAKVLGCAFFLVNLTLLFAVMSRSTLIAILGAIGLWHVSNLIFDFAGLTDLSYLEMIRNMDKVLGGVADPYQELAGLGWLYFISLLLGVLATGLFISKDPPK